MLYYKNKQIAKSTFNSQKLAADDKTLAVSMRSYILPPPEEIERYEALNPGTLKTLLSSYEKQTDHRIDLEKKVIESDIKNSRLGQIFAFIIALVVILGGFALVFLGKDIQGFAAILLALATLLGVFVGKRKINAKRLAEKDRQNPS